MKTIKKQKSPKKIAIALICSAILVASGVIFYTTLNNTGNTGTSTVKPEIEKDKVVNDDANTYEESPVSDTEKPENPAPAPGKNLTPGNTENPDSKPAEPTIANISKTGSTVQVVATFNSTVNGYCKLTLTKSGSIPITKEVPITIGPSYYLCGFTIDSIEGDGWTANVSHMSNGQESNAVSQKIQ